MFEKKNVLPLGIRDSRFGSLMVDLTANAKLKKSLQLREILILASGFGLPVVVNNSLHNIIGTIQTLVH